MRTYKHIRRVLSLLLVVSLAALATSCAYFLGITTDIVPLPTDVTVKSPPRIVNCEAQFIERTCSDHYESVCGYICWDYWWGYYWCCRRVWRYTDCVGEIKLRLTVDDPSNDMAPARSPRVRVFDSTPAAGSTAGNVCLLNVSQQDLPIQSTDITGTGPTKIVTVRIRDVSVRFTSNCRTFAARLPLRIVLTDGNEEIVSLNECEAYVEYKR